MNLAMLALQGQLAEQTTPLTEAQRAEIQAHPVLSRMLLEMAGVDNEDWLQAVVQHHERPDGQGYPYGLRGSSEIAALIRRADIYAAKLSPRATRDAMAADQAGRQMFMQDPGHPMTAALVKEFGVYPPGCWVRLASGECGIVVRRGATVMTPLVSVMSTPQGQPLTRAQQRDTAQKPHAIKGVLAAHEPRPKLPAQLLMKLAVAS
jgi:HD-GYP domain-containing protein (c-di-GMP phosphodiesterase class II)